MASALAIVALAGWLQMVTVGESPSHTRDGVSAERQENLGKQDSKGTALVRIQQATEVVEPVTVKPGLPQEPSHLDLYFREAPSKTPQAPSASIEPLPVATVAAASVGQLSEEQARDVLQAAGWPTELIPQALAVFCGIGNRSGFPRGESGCNPGAVGDSGRSLGFAQLNGATWAPYCGVTQDALLDVAENARCAWQVYNYDLARGQAPWQQWTVKP